MEMEREYLIELNPDFIHRKKVQEEIKHNDGYCITALKRNPDTLCICKEFKEQNHSGWCHCGQYYKVLKTPKVCLCGSSRFREQFFEVAKQLTLEGYNVTMPVLFVKDDLNKLSDDEKKYLNEIHKSKIADADLIYIINYNGYIGNSTREEIDWASQLGKKIKYLEEN